MKKFFSGKCLTALLLSSVAGGAFFYLKKGDIAWLRVSEVAITVEPPLTEAEIQKLLPSLRGKNLLGVSGSELMSKMLQNPWVLSASVKKEFPNRLLLAVQAKHPVATRQDVSRLTFIDEEGAEIDRWSVARAMNMDLPVIAFEKPELARDWSLRQLVKILCGIQKSLSPKYRVSQVVATDPPYFKVYLTSPSLEMLFSLHTWESQLPFFNDLLSRPPRQIGQAHRINLVFPKKAVVSFPLSH